MELWIRSQDKDFLMKVNNINLGYQNDGNNKKINESRRLFTFTKDTSVILGVYKTKERALEVLDEIQNILKPKIVIKFDNKPKYLEDGKINAVLIPREEIDYTKQLSTYVYEIPKE